MSASGDVQTALLIEEIISEWSIWKQKVEDGSATLEDTPNFILGYRPVFELNKNTSINDLLKWAANPFKFGSGSLNAVDYEIVYKENGISKTATNALLEFTYGYSTRQGHNRRRRVFPIVLLKGFSDDDLPQSPDIIPPIYPITAFSTNSPTERVLFEMAMDRAGFVRHGFGNPLESLHFNDQQSVRDRLENLSPFFKNLTIDDTDDILFEGTNNYMLVNHSGGSDDINLQEMTTASKMSSDIANFNAFMRQSVLTSRQSEVNIEFPILLKAKIDVNKWNLTSTAIPPTLQAFWEEYQQDLETLGIETDRKKRKAEDWPESADSDVRPTKRSHSDAQIRAALKRTGGNVAQAAALLERMRL